MSGTYTNVYYTYSNVLTVYGDLPTVSYRPNQVGINTPDVAADSSAVVIISKYNTKDRVVLNNGSSNIIIDLTNKRIY